MSCPFGRPSSVADPVTVAVAGRVMVWAGPVVTAGARLTGAGGGGGYLWWAKSRQSPPAEVPTAAVQAVTDIQDTVDAVNLRAVEEIYSGGATEDQAAEIPDVNPYRDTNPFSDLKTNPFE